jgi:hypothetical protein
LRELRQRDARPSPDFSTGAPNFDKPIVGYNVRMAYDFDRSGLPVEQHDGKRY